MATQEAIDAWNQLGLAGSSLGGIQLVPRSGGGGANGDTSADSPTTGPVDANGNPIPPSPGNQWVASVDAFGNLSWRQEAAYDSSGGDGGAGLSYSLGLKGLEVDWARVGLDRQRVANEKAQTAISAKAQAEAARANRAQEAAVARQRALDAASNAVSSYLKGTELADARRLAAFSEARQLLPFMVNKEQQYQAGFEPTGPLSKAIQGFGFQFQPQELPKATFRPGELAQTPTASQIGAGIIGGIGDIRAAGSIGQRGVGS